MEGAGVGIAIAVGALALVLYLNKRSEQQTAMQIAAINKAKQGETLGLRDTIGLAATTVATVYGGPAAGAAAAKVTGVTF